MFVPTSSCLSDMNHDGVVDDLDFRVFVLANNELVCLEEQAARCGGRDDWGGRG